VYITTAGVVRLLDFNPYGGATLPLLFTWPELDALAQGEGEDGGDGAARLPEVRVIQTPQMVRPGLRTGVPVEFYDASQGSALSQMLERLRAEERQ
jgi:hypothetical protein